MRRLESQIAQAEAQAHTAEEACAQLQQEVQQLTQTLEEAGASSELHVQVCPQPESRAVTGRVNHPCLGDLGDRH